MADQHPSRALATALWVLPPVWLTPLPAACWAYLAAGLGGQDVGMFAWVRWLCLGLSPYQYGVELDLVHLAVYVFVHGSILAVLGAIALGSRSTLRGHALGALIVAVLAVPLVAVLPYGMGVVAALPVEGFSMVADQPTFSAEWSPPARRAAGQLLAGLIILAPGILYWREQLTAARAGEDATLPDRAALTRVGVGLGIGVFLLIAATVATSA